MKAIIFVLLVFLIFSSVATAEELKKDGQTYYMQNTTSNLLQLNQKLVEFGGSLIFSPEEQSELSEIINDDNTAQILNTQKKLLASSNLSEVNIKSYGSAYQSNYMEQTYQDTIDAQEVVSMKTAFHSFDFLIRQYSKAEGMIEQLAGNKTA